MTETLAVDEKLAWLRLIRSENVGPISFFMLLRTYGSAQNALDSLPELARRGGRKKPLKPYGLKEAEEEWLRLEKLGGQFLAWSEYCYAPLLRQINDPPPLLAVRGNIELLRRSCLALVGGRKASLNSRNLARHMAEKLGNENLVIVSGLARGIDSAAHEGAIKQGTIAVMAGGVDVVYPPENQKLYEEICEIGAVISEMPVGTEPQARQFPRRNRIISGLSYGTLVFEAAKRSGSLITARFAAEQGREVMVIPGSPLDPRSQGSNQLIQEGACLVQSVNDIMEVIRPHIDNPLQEPKRVFQEAPTTAYKEEELNELRHIIENALSLTPTALDDLIRETSAPVTAISTVLLELELAGRLVRLSGNRYHLVASPQEE